MAKGNVLDELLVELKGDVSGLTSSLRVAEKEVERSTKSINVTLAGMGSAFLSLAKWAAAAGTAIAATGIAIGTVLTKRSLDAIDATAKLSDQLGIQTEKLAGLQLAAGLAGIESEALGTAIRFMLRGIEEAQSGTGAQADALKTLGLNAAELRAMRPEEALGAIADSMNGLATAGERNAAAMALFGRGGGPMLSMLREGSAGLKAAQQEAERLGLAVSRLDAAKVEAANDAFTRLGAVATGVGNQIAVGLSQYIEAAAMELYRASEASGGFRAELESLGRFGVGVVKILADIWHGLVIQFRAAQVALATIGEYGWRATQRVVEGTSAAYMAVEDLGAVAKATGSLIGHAFSTAWAWAKYTLAAFVQQANASFADMLDTLGRSLLRVKGGIGQALIDAGNQIRQNTGDWAAENRRELDQAKADTSAAATEMVAAIAAVGARESGIPFLDQVVEQARLLAARLRAKFMEALNAPLPSAGIDETLDRITSKATEAARKVAEATGQQLGPPSPGGGLTDKQREENEKKLEELRKYLATERELEVQSFMEKSALLAELRKTEQITETDERLLRERLEQDHAKRLTEIHKKEADERQRMHIVGINAVSGATVNLLQTLASMQDSSSKKSFERQKKLSMAAAIVSTAAGVAAAFRDVPYPYNFVAAAAVAAAGGAQIAKIASTSFGGGGGSVAAPAGPGSAGDGAAAGVAGAAQEGQQVVVNIAGGDGARFTGREVREMINAIGAQLADGATIGNLRTA